MRHAPDEGACVSQVSLRLRQVRRADGRQEAAAKGVEAGEWSRRAPSGPHGLLGLLPALGQGVGRPDRERRSATTRIQWSVNAPWGTVRSFTVGM